MPCDFCHASLPADAQYCPQCGTVIAVPGGHDPYFADPAGKFANGPPPGSQWYVPNSGAQGVSGMAVGSLVSGIAAWLAFPVIGAVVAVVLGHMARREIREGAGAVGGDGMAVTGLVLGYIQLALLLLVLVVGAGILLIVLFSHR